MLLGEVLEVELLLLLLLLVAVVAFWLIWPLAGGGGGGGGGGNGVGGRGGVTTTADRRPTSGVSDAAGSTTLTTWDGAAPIEVVGTGGCVRRTTGNVDGGRGAAVGVGVGVGVGAGVAVGAGTAGISNGITSSHNSVTSSS